MAQITDEQRKYIGWIAKAIYGDLGDGYINPLDDAEIPVYVVLANGEKVIPTVEQIQAGWLLVKAELDAITAQPPVITLEESHRALELRIAELERIIREAKLI